VIGISLYIILQMRDIICMLCNQLKYCDQLKHRLKIVITSLILDDCRTYITVYVFMLTSYRYCLHLSTYQHGNVHIHAPILCTYTYAWTSQMQYIHPDISFYCYLFCMQVIRYVCCSRRAVNHAWYAGRFNTYVHSPATS
jgi:hypothetical protein